MNGIICLNKESTKTSFASCKEVQALAGSHKAGHTGTLDPLATGVLPIALGGAVRFIGLFPLSKKSYSARFTLGKRTDTLDITGNVISRSNKTACLEDIKKILPSFSGEIKQIPPMYSAIKKDGVRLYELARRGLVTERDAKTVSIYEISVRQEEDNDFSLFVSCSPGTYIRSIIDDIGNMLGCGAVMTALVRTLSNGFYLDECKTLSQLKSLKDNDRLSEAVIPVDRALSLFPQVTITAPQSIRFKNGGELFLDRLDIEKGDGLFRVYSPGGDFSGVGDACCAKGVLKVKRVYSEL